jgi:uncharacterized damage-inducible protein DinB
MKLSNPKFSEFTAHFAALYDGAPWYGDPLSKILKDVTPAQAFWQPLEGSHSIAEIISHILYWRQGLISRLNGDTGYRPSMKSDDNWKSVKELKKMGWKSLRNSLEKNQAQLLSLIAKQTDSLLKKDYTERATFDDLITGILHHDLYHIGQIAYIKSLYKKQLPRGLSPWQSI